MIAHLYPNTFTVTLKEGRFEIRETSTTDTEAGTYDATGSHLELHSQGNTTAFDVARDSDGTLHLTSVPPITDIGGQFVLTTKPWTKK